jgi:hypothetical protein
MIKKIFSIVRVQKIHLLHDLGDHGRCGEEQQMQKECNDEGERNHDPTVWPWLLPHFIQIIQTGKIVDDRNSSVRGSFCEKLVFLS